MNSIDVARQAKEHGVQLFRFRKGTETDPQYDCKPWGTGNKRGWVILDTFSASAICAVYDKLSEPNQLKYRNMPLYRMAEVAFKLINKQEN